jgi:hypothetical protein
MAKTLTLRNIPPEVYKILLDEQAKEKQVRGNGMFSLESTVYKMIKECARCRENGREVRK